MLREEPCLQGFLVELQGGPSEPFPVTRDDPAVSTGLEVTGAVVLGVMNRPLVTSQAWVPALWL